MKPKTHNWMEIIHNPNNEDQFKWINSSIQLEPKQLIGASPLFWRLESYLIAVVVCFHSSIQQMHKSIVFRMILFRLFLLCAVTGRHLRISSTWAIHSGECRFFQSSSICTGDGERKIKEVFVRCNEWVWIIGLWWDYRRGCFRILFVWRQLEDRQTTVWSQSLHMSRTMQGYIWICEWIP